MLINIGDGQSANFRVEVDGLASGGFGYSGIVQQNGTAGAKPEIDWILNSDGTVSAYWGAGEGSGTTYRTYTSIQHYASGPAEAGLNYDWTDGSFGTGTGGNFSLQPGDKLYLTVEASQTNSSGGVIYGFNSSTYTMSGAPLPASPMNLVATLTDPTHVLLHWNNMSNTEDSFDIYRSTDPSFESDVTKIGHTGADVTTYTDELPDSVNTYYYEVYSFLALAELSGTTPPVADGTVLSAPAVSEPAGGESQNGAKSGPIQAVGLKSVGFSGVFVSANGSQTNDEAEIKLDDGDGSYPTGQADWLDTNENGSIDGGPTPLEDGTIAPLSQDGSLNTAAEHEWPVAFGLSLNGSGAFFTVSPVFGGTWQPGTEIRGHAVGHSPESGLEFLPVFGETKATQVNGGFTASLSASLPEVIYFAQLTIQWEVSVNGGKSWVDAGKSTDPFYVTGKQAPGSEFQTVLYVGCNGAFGLAPSNIGETHEDQTTADENVANGIFLVQFKSLQLHDVEGNLLTYWGPQYGLGKAWPGLRNGVNSLLKYHDGRCQEWCDFFQVVLDCEGVISREATITMSYHGKVPAMPQGATDEGFYTPEKAQGGTVPTEQWFANHVVVEYDGWNGSIVFDPSYGVSDSAASLDAAKDSWRAQAIAAGAKGVYVKLGGFVNNAPAYMGGGTVPTGYVAVGALFAVQPGDFSISP